MFKINLKKVKKFCLFPVKIDMWGVFSVAKYKFCVGINCKIQNS